MHVTNSYSGLAFPQTIDPFPVKGRRREYRKGSINESPKAPIYSEGLCKTLLLHLMCYIYACHLRANVLHLIVDSFLVIGVIESHHRAPIDKPFVVVIHRLHLFQECKEV